jgi:hypothetical protein
VSTPLASTSRGVMRVLILADAPVLRRGLIGMVNETAGLQRWAPGEPRRALTLAECARPDAGAVQPADRQNLFVSGTRSSPM